MKFSILLVSLFATSALAMNAGIFEDDGQVKEALPLPPTTDNAPLPRMLKRETNAERFRRGLGPLSPAMKRTPTRANSPRASSIPCAGTPFTTNTGTITVRSVADNTFLGHVSKTFDSQRSYTIGSDSLRVTIPFLTSDGSTPSGPFDITAVNGPDDVHTHVGPVGGSGSYSTFGSGHSDYAYLAGVGHTDAHSPPSSTAGTSIQKLGYNGPSESQVWYLNCATLEITAQWTNVDGSEPPTSIFYDGAVNSLDITGDLDAFNAAFPGENTTAVKLFFKPSA